MTLSTTEAEAKGKTTEATTDAEEAPKKRSSKEPPPPRQREVRASKADQKIDAVIEFVKNAGEPVTYQEIQEGADVLYDVCLFSLTAMEKFGIVKKVGTWEGTGRARIAWEWVSDTPTAPATAKAAAKK